MSPDDQPNLTRQTLRGLQWTYADALVSSVLQILVAAVLARLLDPVAFGVVALAVLALRFVDQASRGGMAQAIIQKPDLTKNDIRTGFTLSVALGFAFAAVVLVLSPVAGTVFRNDEVVGVLRWMSLMLPIANAGAVAEGLLRRELRFSTIAKRNVASYILGYAGVGLVMATMGYGVEALVAAALSQALLKSVLAYIAVRHDVRPQWDRESMRDLLGFGGRISVISFMEFLGTELDTLAVGRFLGVGALGLYNRAYLLVEVPMYHLNHSLSTVLFPALSRIQEETGRLRDTYLSAVRLSSSIVMPISAGIAVAASEIIGVLLGPKWLGAVEVVPWMALSAAISTLSHFAGITAEAKGALNAKFKAVVIKVAVLAGSLYAVRDQRLWAFGAAILLATVVGHIGYTAIAARITEAPVRMVVASYGASIPAALSVAAGIGLVRVFLLGLDLHIGLVLFGEVVTGAVILFGQLRWGLLRGTIREIARRLSNAGTLRPGSRATELATKVFGSLVSDAVGE